MHWWQWALLAGVALCIILIFLSLLCTEDKDPNPGSWNNHWEGADK